MENLSVALKHVSEAVNLDSSGFQQAAFAKYIQSLQVLIYYLNTLFTSLGFEKICEEKKKVMQVLSMIHECSDRISVILNDYGKPTESFAENLSEFVRSTKSYMPESNISKISDFEKIQHENMQLFKLYKMRLEKANDKYTKSNLNLEFQRRISENAVLAKKKYEETVKQLQKERVLLMEKAIRNLFENGRQLNEKEKEKRDLYDRVLQYVKTETWPSSWKLSSYELTAYEMAYKIFYKIMRCFEHPLTQWLFLIQTDIKRKIDDVLKEYSEYISFLPEFLSESEFKLHFIDEHLNQVVINSSRFEGITSAEKLSSLENTIETITSEIRSVIGDALEIFYLIYKSLLPDESETVCYHVIEKIFLKSMWFSLFTLFRVINLLSEYKVAESMQLHRYCSPLKFGIMSCMSRTDEFYNDLAKQLRGIHQHQSLVNKLKILVQITQTISEYSSPENSAQRKLGADEILPVLCYVIVKSGLPHLVSECHMLELLFDIRYTLGEEGYALTSFLTALKCIEIKKLTECESSEGNT